MPPNPCRFAQVSEKMESIRSREGAKLAKILEFFAPSRALREFTILLTTTKFVQIFAVGILAIA